MYTCRCVYILVHVHAHSLPSTPPFFLPNWNFSFRNSQVRATLFNFVSASFLPFVFSFQRTGAVAFNIYVGRCVILMLFIWMYGRLVPKTLLCY